MRPFNPSIFVLLLGFFLNGNTLLNASISCPDDITLDCTMNYQDTNITGVGIVHGYSAVARYIDQVNLNSCRLGTVRRTWYADKNNNYQLDEVEVTCVQWITINDIVSNPTVIFPDDKTYSCIEDIQYDEPYYYGGPCDNFGVNVDDQVFTVADGVCYKILRRFTVINWCDYRPSDPNWDGSGIWEGSQKIKVIDNQAPKLMDEDDVIVGVGSNCLASVTLSNYAVDAGNCPSGELSYELYIDTDWDGVLETRYSYLLDDEYYIAPAQNGASVSVDLVEQFKIGEYKFKWVVKDGCGNIRTEPSKLKVKDLKPPTPYCLSFMHAAFDGANDELRVTPKMFDRGSFDNCAWPEQLLFSFSEDVNDTLRIVNCDNQGIQFYRMYVTDHFGNQDYCEIFLLAFDNGSCNFSFSPIGNVALMDGTGLAEVDVKVNSDETSAIVEASTDEFGNFVLTNVPLQEEFTVVADKEMNFAEEINTLDLVLLYRHLLGYESIETFEELMIGDINQDQRVSARDLSDMRDVILGRANNIKDLGDLKFVNQYKLHNAVDIDELKNFYNLYNYRGGYDFNAYVLGDMDHSHIQVINETLEGRDLQEIEVLISYHEDKTQLSFVENVEIDGIELSIQKNLPLASNDFLLGAQSLYQAETNSKIVHIEKGLSIDAGQVWLEIEGVLKLDDLEGIIVSSNAKTAQNLVFRYQANNIELSAFPNPVRETLYFTNLASFNLYSANGALLMQSSRLQDRIELSSLQAGLYLIELRDQVGNTQIQKVLKQ